MTDVKKLLASAQYRPYTAYNIFFQLEREFILQSILGVTPSVDAAFDQAKDDVIPILPRKYREIVLSNDWYIPGKTQRKKRKHRKSHGKISFSDLSKRVAVSWHNADDEVKLFCAEVSDFLMQEYKKALYQQKQQNNGINIKEKEETSTQTQGAKKEEAIRSNTLISSQVAYSTTEKEVSSTASATDTASASGAQPGMHQHKAAAEMRQNNKVQKVDYNDCVGDSQMSRDEDYGPHIQKSIICNSQSVPESSLKDDDAELDSSAPNDSNGISNLRTNNDESLVESEHRASEHTDSTNSLPSVGQLSLPPSSQHHYNYFSGYKTT